ncbi:hypothetical protein [Bacillus tropicus]|uniref:hypothetical protein n=1 Tax=Bacillus tropicus TaxID=2026188 RepID=UPI0035D86F26
MNEDIRKIYNLLNSPVLTPYNLLENVKLNNYHYVNYYKGEVGIICEMKCNTEDGDELKYFYHFDNNDYLFQVYMQPTNGEKLMVFDRGQELNNEVNKYLSKNKEQAAVI